jgi:hypothetical protein
MMERDMVNSLMFSVNRKIPERCINKKRLEEYVVMEVLRGE